MPLLHFSHDDAPPLQFDATLEATRKRFLEQHSVDFDDPLHRHARLPADTPFFAYPEQLLYAYETHREASELGHVFRIANGLHDEIDAVVIVGPEPLIAASRALMIACCDPFHNEQTRAARGSKPRMYFDPDDLDNDAIHSLVARLNQGGYGDTKADTSWAMICVGPEKDASSTITSSILQTGHRKQHDAQQAVAALNDEKRDSIERMIPGRRISITSEIEADVVDAEDERLSLPSPSSLLQTSLSPSTLLPAAMLGLDCIQLLVGAAQINEHFCNAEGDENMILRYVAVDRQARQSSSGDLPTSQRSPALRCWSRSFDGLSAWWGLVQPLSVSVACRHDHPQVGIVHHLCVDEIRTDPISTELANATNTSQENRSVPELLREKFEHDQQRLRVNQVPQTVLRLPQLDTNSLGQWIQFHLLAAEIESSSAL